LKCVQGATTLQVIIVPVVNQPFLDYEYIQSPYFHQSYSCPHPHHRSVLTRVTVLPAAAFVSLNVPDKEARIKLSPETNPPNATPLPSTLAAMPPSEILSVAVIPDDREHFRRDVNHEGFVAVHIAVWLEKANYFQYA